MHLPELLCPAGDLTRLKAAIDYGADAVYLAGQTMGMRSASRNFTPSQLEEGVSYAHAKGKKVYLACNALLRNHQMNALPALASQWAQCGVDAFIVGDMGALRILKHTLPDMPVHISVQTGLANYEAVRMMADLGACRAILARELSLDEIAEIRSKTPDLIELEAFVHGSMCVSVSGRCLLSDYLTMEKTPHQDGLTCRSGNGGDCAQPCRWKYALVEEKRPGEYYPVDENEGGSFILNSKDLCMISHIPELIAAGVSSFKIEGRAKSAYYTAVTANAYRCALDGWKAAGCPASFQPAPWILEELNKVSHRPYDTGFYLGGHGGQHTFQGGYLRDWTVMGLVTDFAQGRLFVTQRNKLCTGDTIEVLEPGNPPFSLTVCDLRDGEGISIDSTPHPTMPYSFVCDRPVRPGALLRRAT